MHGRFPAGCGEIPDQAVAHVARLVDVPAAELGFYEWDGRTIKAYPADIRRYFGFPGCSVADADKAAEWLSANVCEKERQAGQVREERAEDRQGTRVHQLVIRHHVEHLAVEGRGQPGRVRGRMVLAPRARQAFLECFAGPAA